ncbi:MAG: hypothetical protein OYK82_08710 [Gammaproteobacteria bacterium]|nr:hypothetical protein [Gammaproteobacteria bacterium]
MVAVRNEERNVEGALRSLLALDYPDHERVFVEDPSRSLCSAGATRSIAPVSAQSCELTNPRWPIAGTGCVRMKGRLTAERDNGSSGARDELPTSRRRFFPGARKPA